MNIFRKILITPLIICAILTGCSGTNDEPAAAADKEVSVSLNYILFESGTMSKAADEAYDKFYTQYIKTKQLAPKTYNLTFSQNGTTLLTAKGLWEASDALRLIPGEYHIDGHSKASNANDCYSDSLDLAFSEDYRISASSTQILLKAEYNCFLLMFDAGNIEAVQTKWVNANSMVDTPANISAPKVGEFYYLFVTNTRKENSVYHQYTATLSLEIKRKDGSTLTLDLSSFPFEKGRYYYFNDIANSFDIQKMSAG